MELTFPFKNWAFNSLLGLIKVGKIENYLKSDQSSEEWSEKDFDVQFYRDRVPDFENELLQVINTSNQETIDHYFISLSDDINYLNSLLSKEHLRQIIEEWNEEELKKYDELVTKKSEEYASEPNRQRDHLKNYEQEIILPRFLGFNDKPKKIQKTNYNYYCVEDNLKNVDLSIVEDYSIFLKEEAKLFIGTARKYGIPWREGKIKSKEDSDSALKPILFCEGVIDILLIQKAAELLGKDELILKIDFRYRGSCNNLDKLWSILTDNNWETVPQKKILLYDCDTNRQNEDFGHIHRRTIPKFKEHIIQRGIENLFPEPTINRARDFKKEFVDFKIIKGTERGVDYEKSETIINKHEKRNFSDWIFENGTADDFIHFSIIFDLIEKLL